ncbi:MAG: purine-binding chemotaxis protein CheW [Gammaproteobacteria bacterium]|nr:purine-binding chemotaxis protein CheW [Gammaproteobacteria bacterium]MCP5199184.1 purine-binding chemotaxis protein CheW [Gammaproteobacteria bacterium]
MGIGNEAGNADQYLTFLLNGEEYGVDILRVQEIKGWMPTTKIPNTPEYIRGVMNLRGAIVPIIDLRLRFNMPAIEYTATTVVIVLKVEHEAGERTIGFVVDAVSDVYNVTAEQFNPAPDFGEHAHTDFIRALATVDDKMVILLDIDQLVGRDAAMHAASQH